VPFSMTNIPGKQALFLTDASGGVETFDFSHGFSGQTAALTVINTTTTPCWSNFSPKAGNFFIDDIATDLVSEIHLDSNLKATVVKQYALAPNSALLDNSIVTVQGKEYLVAIQANATAVSVLAINGPGNAKVTQTLNLAGSPGVTLGVNMIGMATFSLW